MSNLLYGGNRLWVDGWRESSAQRMRRGVAGRILAVELALAGGALVDAAGMVCRLQALVAVAIPGLTWPTIWGCCQVTSGGWSTVASV